MILSILICSLPNRANKLAGLLDNLRQQAEGKPVEILVDDRPRPVTVGEKSQALYEKASGKYVCRIDDDDRVANDYVDMILEAASKDPDTIGFKVMCHNGNRQDPAAVSVRYDWADNYDGMRYVRSTHHLTPVRRSIALQAGFPKRDHGEDYAYSMALKGKLKSEVFIDRFLYEYLFTPNKKPGE